MGGGGREKKKGRESTSALARERREGDGPHLKDQTRRKGADDFCVYLGGRKGGRGTSAPKKRFEFPYGTGDKKKSAAQKGKTEKKRKQFLHHKAKEKKKEKNNIEERFMGKLRQGKRRGENALPTSYSLSFSSTG